MAACTRFFTALIGVSLFVTPTLLAQGHGGGGADDATNGHNGSGRGGSGGGSGSSGGGGGGSGGQSGSSASSAVRSAQDALRTAGDAAERAIKDEKEARVRAILVMRAQGATSADVAAADAAIAALVTSGTTQINTLRDSLLAGLPATATVSQRNSVTAAATAAVNKLLQRQRSANQDVRRASVGPIPANFPGEHAMPEHFPGHR